MTYARTQLDMPDGGTVALDYEDFDKDLPYGLDRVSSLSHNCPMFMYHIWWPISNTQQ